MSRKIKDRILAALPTLETHPGLMRTKRVVARDGSTIRVLDIAATAQVIETFNLTTT